MSIFDTEIEQLSAIELKQLGEGDMHSTISRQHFLSTEKWKDEITKAMSLFWMILVDFLCTRNVFFLDGPRLVPSAEQETKCAKLY